MVDTQALKKALFDLGKGFSPFCYLDSNDYPPGENSRYACLAAFGAEAELVLDSETGAFDRLRAFSEENPGWLFCALSYDLKNDVEALRSSHPERLEMPFLHVFKPLFTAVVRLDGSLELHGNHIPPDLEPWLAQPQENPKPVASIQVKPRLSRQEYLDKVSALREHIAAGDIYEVNFCQEFYAENQRIDPYGLFQRLNAISRAPFSAFYQIRQSYLICASPERFLQKTGDRLVSQPIKGTRPRGEDEASDLLHKQALRESEKDQAENVMIVDLVRNDLARTCLPGTVQVEELFGIYPFRQVYQMISTISGRLRPEAHWVDAIRHAFPMGSMTGAPKVMSMELIERYEVSRRGWYSGAVGYIDPNRDFDLNVVIRSLFYQAESGYLSFQVGGAIVYDSEPEKEYEECLVKARGVLMALGQSVSE